MNSETRMGLYIAFCGTSHASPLSSRKNALSVTSPSSMATTMSPSSAVLATRIVTMSPSSMPASHIDSPCTVIITTGS